MPILDRGDEQMTRKYTEFVRTSPFAQATQDIAWSEVKQGWESEQVYLTHDGQITAALSIIFKNALLGRSMAYAPRGPVCDPEDLETIQKLIDEARPVLKKHRAFLLRFDPEAPYDPALCARYEKAGFMVRNRDCEKGDLIQPRYNMVLDLAGQSFDELMKGFSEKTRYNIRLASRKGVSVRYSRDEADLKLFYDIYQVTTQRDKIGARPYSYFERMLHVYGPEQLRIYIAQAEGKALSGAVALRYGKKMWYIYGASSNELRNYMPNYAMQSEMIRWAIECGCEKYDFGGVFVLDKKDGLYKFKEGFCHQQGCSEYVGEFDKVLDPFWYRLMTKHAPQVKKFLRRGAQ